MKCPTCKKTVRDGTSICPHCDAILDDSFLGELPSDLEATPAPRSRKVSAPRAAPAPSHDDVTNPGFAPEEQTLPGVRASEPGGDAASSDPFEQLKQLSAAFFRLAFEDRLTVASACLLGLSVLFPWRESLTEGGEIGLLSGASGILVLIVAVGAVLTVWAREAGKLPRIERARFPLATCGAGAAALLLSSVFALSSFEKGVGSMKTVLVAEPAFGVFVAALLSAGVLVGGLLTYKRER